MRILTFYYEYSSTVNNHCGMAYFANCLKQQSGLKVTLIRVPKRYARYHSYLKKIWRLVVVRICRMLCRRDDVFFFMEYINPSKAPGEQCLIASDLRGLGMENRMIGLVHLPPKLMLDTLGEEYIREEASKIDEILVMGSNLKKVFLDMGFADKVVQTFHYVDTNYYYPGEAHLELEKYPEFRVFVSGYLLRDHETLYKIIRSCPDVHFDLCLGLRRIDDKFHNCPNATVYPFLSEKELLKKMQAAHVSLSVMTDAVANNVLVTSMACGLPQVLSDVGAVRDYCSSSNAIFCKEPTDFVKAILGLQADRKTLRMMALDARREAEKISLEKSIEWYVDFFSLNK